MHHKNNNSHNNIRRKKHYFIQTFQPISLINLPHLPLPLLRNPFLKLHLPPTHLHNPHTRNRLTNKRHPLIRNRRHLRPQHSKLLTQIKLHRHEPKHQNRHTHRKRRTHNKNTQNQNRHGLQRRPNSIRTEQRRHQKPFHVVTDQIHNLTGRDVVPLAAADGTQTQRLGKYRAHGADAELHSFAPRDHKHVVVFKEYYGVAEDEDSGPEVSPSGGVDGVG
mmetsp:Transcript_62329/g.73828  ORF Transcript_62329/g.73828 Transcript_62329/m.73828 type:complete len:220 (+) Transcript_62329:1994-2653(+)